MSRAEKRTVTLTAEQGSFIDSLVESGAYASANEVIRAGIEALQEQDAQIERWLREEVAPVHDRMQADPRRGLTSAQVAAALDAVHGERVKSSESGL